MKKLSRASFLNSTAALLLGILLTFAFAPFHLTFLSYLTIAGLLGLLRTVAKTKSAFYLGLWFGIGLFGAGVNWVFHSINIFGGVDIFSAGLLTLGFVLMLALFIAATTAVFYYYCPKPSPLQLVLAFPAIWFFGELARTWLFSGFPWLLLGYSQTDTPLKGFAPIFSVHGVSFVITIISACIVNIIISYKQHRYLTLYANVITILGLWALGFALDLIPWTIPSQAQPMRVALVQGGIPQAIKWSPEYLQLSIDRYVELTDPLWKNADLIIWPESALPLPLQDAQLLIDNLDTKAKENHTTLMLGIPIQTETANGYYNAIISLGKTNQVYLKRHLVPFGEYLPNFRLFASFFNFMQIPISALQPGNMEQKPFLVDNVKILPSICYEIAFPNLIRARDKTLGFLLTITNDAWFGKSNASAQHLQMGAMRAIEMRRPLLFVSNDGITAIISPNGIIEAAAPQYTAYVLNGTIMPMEGLTPWMKNGLDPLIFIIIVSIIYLLIKDKRFKQALTTKIQTKHKKLKSSK